MSLKKAIKKRIPYNWEYVLRKNKVFTSFVDQFYSYRIKLAYHTVDKKKRLEVFKAYLTVYLDTLSFNHSLPFDKTVEGKVFWEKINQEIINYTEQCK